MPFDTPAKKKAKKGFSPIFGISPQSREQMAAMSGGHAPTMQVSAEGIRSTSTGELLDASQIAAAVRRRRAERRRKKEQSSKGE